MKIRWLGHAAFRIETAGSTILIDPFLTHNPLFQGQDIKEATKGVTHILLTHGHMDHVGDTIALAGELVSRGCDFVDVSSAGISPKQRIESKPGLHVPFARAIRDATRVPTIVVGLVTEPAHADAIVANGDADLVALARGMLWNPRWPWHAAKALGAGVAVPPQYLRAVPRWK